MIDLDELERTAREAQAEQPGPWHTGEADPSGIDYAGACYTDEVFGAADPYYVLAECDGPLVATFIALANPAAVLELVARLRALEAERDQLRAAIAGYKAATERCDGIIDAERAMFRALGDPTFICPGCGRETNVVFNWSSCPACAGRE